MKPGFHTTLLDVRRNLIDVYREQARRARELAQKHDRLGHRREARKAWARHESILRLVEKEIREYHAALGTPLPPCKERT